MQRTFLVAIAMLAAVGTTLAAGWTTKPLPLKDWSSVERGTPGSMSWHSYAEYKQGNTYFAFGCAFASELSISWDPGKPLASSTGVETRFSINGKLIATQTLEDPNGGTSFRLAEEEGPSRIIIEAIAAAGKGTLTVAGGGVTTTIPFDDGKMNNFATSILSCGS